MKSHVLSGLVSILSVGLVPVAWADRTETTRTLTADEDYSDVGVLTIPADVTIDLAGHRLTYRGVTGLPAAGTGTFDDSSDGSPGVLTIEDNADSTQSIFLKGNLKFVKAGSGTWSVPTARTPQSFTGGVSVEGGVLTTAKYGKIEGSDTPYGVSPTVDVHVGATVDLNGCYDLSRMTVNLRGGTLKNGRMVSNEAYCFKAPINVCAESTFSTGKDKDFNYAGDLNLNGNVLNLSFGATFHWHPKSAANGTVRTVRGAFLVSAETDMKTVDLDANVAMNLKADCSVRDYRANYDGDDNSGTGTLSVHGRFVPNQERFYPPKMMDGSTIDLSSLSLPWTATGVAFDSGATVTIDVGGKAVAVGDSLVAWSAPDYKGCTFVLSGTRVEGLVLGWDETGLVVQSADRAVARADWSGAAGDGDVTNPENWTCRTAGGATVSGALPNSGVAVTIPHAALATIDCPAGVAFVCRTLTVSGEKPEGAIALSASRDWRGLGPLSDFPFSIELNGHDLALQLGTGASAAALTICNSSETAAKLRVDVSGTDIFENSHVTLKGNLTLVKEGAGTFVQTRTAQAYSGETRVAGGVLATAGGDMSADGVSPFGTARSVTVAAGGALDPRGSYNWSDYTIVLDGGMISNTVAETGADNTAYTVKAGGVDRAFDPRVVLQNDSVFATDRDYTFLAAVDTNGFALKAWIGSDADLRWQPNAVKGGEPLAVDVRGSGDVFVLRNYPLVQPEMTLTMSERSWLTMGGEMSVSNYVAASENDRFEYKATYGPKMRIYGTFVPVTQNFVGCTMQDGSTIDLSRKETAWNSRGYAKPDKEGGNAVKGDVDFAEGAMVTIDVGEREFRGVEQVVAWSEGSKASAAGARFVLAAAAKAKGYGLARDENGLYVGRKGFQWMVY